MPDLGHAQPPFRSCGRGFSIFRTSRERTESVHVAPADRAALPVHRLTAELSPTNDQGLTLRMVSLLHRRGVPLVEMHLRAQDSATAEGDIRTGPPSQFTVCFRSTEEHARVVLAGFTSVVNVLRVTLELDVKWHVPA